MPMPIHSPLLLCRQLVYFRLDLQLPASRRI